MAGEVHTPLKGFTAEPLLDTTDIRTTAVHLFEVDGPHGTTLTVTARGVLRSAGATYASQIAAHQQAYRERENASSGMTEPQSF